VAEQTEQLNRMNRPRDFDAPDDEDEEHTAQQQPAEDLVFTEEDMRREEEEVKELERKKRSLEERVSAMEKDISGVIG
jgi:predicted RNase H-like nuclease (RuvC/YqgF family)